MEEKLIELRDRILDLALEMDNEALSRIPLNKSEHVAHALLLAEREGIMRVYWLVMKEAERVAEERE